MHPSRCLWHRGATSRGPGTASSSHHICSTLQTELGLWTLPDHTVRCQSLSSSNAASCMSLNPLTPHIHSSTFRGLRSAQQPFLLSCVQRTFQSSITTRAADDGTASTTSTVQQPLQQTNQRKYSPLHYNILDFCQRVVPTEEENKYKQHVVTQIRSSAVKAMQEAGRRCDVQVFGSMATGLATWSSDVDLVVTGVMEPDRYTGVYDIHERGRVVGRLRRIGEALRRCKKLDNPRISIIPKARIPIIKLKVKNVNIDISISDDTGPRAARYMAQQVRAYPPMRPLVLVLKAYLRTCGLNEVMYGGLSSYSLCNMVVAHLQEELKAGRDIFDLGEALYAFLLRYGEEFDYSQDAVSIESGGIVPKAVLGMHTGFPAGGGRGYASELDRFMERLTVDCPISGRDVSNGSYRIDAVRMAFQRASRRLEALAQGRRMDDTTVNYLQALFDVNRVLKRSSDMMDYEDDFIRVMGRGTSPEVIQLDRGRGDWDEEEELLETDADGDTMSETATDTQDDWLNSDSESLPPSATESKGPRGKGSSKGGPRGKGWK